MNRDGILSGTLIEHLVRRGVIDIRPFNAAHVNPASYDLTLGTGVVRYVMNQFDFLDAKEKPTVRVETIPDDGYFLLPGNLYLMHTVETICTKEYVPVMDGKSSIGRLGISVHLTAGYGDPGFDGQYTLEVTAVHPVRVYAGMRIAQMRFHTMVGSGPLYQGQYQGETAMGAVPSRAWRQFAKDSPSRAGTSPGSGRIATWCPPPDLPLLGMRPDTRSQRWKDAEARCTANEAPSDALAIIAEEQAKWDATNMNCIVGGCVNNEDTTLGVGAEPCEVCRGHV